jgi:hypothetical protein
MTVHSSLFSMHPYDHLPPNLLRICVLFMHIRPNINMKYSELNWTKLT